MSESVRTTTSASVSMRTASSKKSAASSKKSVDVLPPAVEAGSQRSQASTTKTGSKRSITSSQALGKLDQLEKLLLEERRAREQAEDTLLALQRERVGRESERQKSEQTQKQLSDVMSALSKVINNPSDPIGRRRLQAILQGHHVTQTSPTPSLPPVAGSNGRGSDAVSVASTTSSQRVQRAKEQGNISFLDSLGQYERDKEREKKKAKALARAGGQLPH